MHQKMTVLLIIIKTNNNNNSNSNNSTTVCVHVLTLDKRLFLEGGRVGLTNPSSSIEEAALPTGAGPVFDCRGFCTVSLESESDFNSITF